MKKIISFVLVFAMLLLSVIPVSAEATPSPKEEVIYGILNLDGSVNNLYVVNIFNGGAITDYGVYSDLYNMTTSEKLSQKGEQITTNTTADKFYYQGTLESNQLPWDITINYFLDNKVISGSDLGGSSGALKINVSVKQNNNINTTFYDNYALQIALALDNKLCTNIKADNATVAEAGSKKQLTYTVLPGNGIDFSVTSDVHDFEMDAISINGINLTLGINVNSEEFTGQIVELTNAINTLDDGAGELLDGLKQLSGGMDAYMNGMKEFKDGLQQFSEGADKLSIGASALKFGLSELAKQNDTLINGALAIQQGTFDSVNVSLGEMKLGLPVLTPENYSTILTSIPELTAAKVQLDGVVAFTQGLKGYMEGVKQIEKGASDLAIGTSEFKSSSNVLATSANELYNAGSELNAAIKKLRDGLALYKDGTKTLKNGTSGMESEISNKVDEMLDSISGKGDKVVSFVSDKNSNVSAVQFVLKTDSITIPRVQSPVEVKPVELTFWQKLLKLVGLL